MILAVRLLLGLAMLLLGRKIFWIFVGVAGFAMGLFLAGRLFHEQPEVLLLVLGLLTGLLGAAVAIFFQRLALWMAGFLSGGYLALSLVAALAGSWGGRLPEWGIFLIGGVLGGILVAVLFDWALIVLSSLTGATLIVQAIPLNQLLSGLAFLTLLAFGIAVQANWLPQEKRPVRRPPARRR